MKFGLHALSFHQISGESLVAICSHLQSLGHEIRASRSIAKSLEKAGIQIPPDHLFGLEDTLNDIDILLSLGGDGTILDSLLYAVPFKIPVLGINFGKLGFLATAQASNLKNWVDQIQLGEFFIENRALKE